MFYLKGAMEDVPVETMDVGVGQKFSNFLAATFLSPHRVSVTCGKTVHMLQQEKLKTSFKCKSQTGYVLLYLRRLWTEFLFQSLFKPVLMNILHFLSLKKNQVLTLAN